MSCASIPRAPMASPRIWMIARRTIQQWQLLCASSHRIHSDGSRTDRKSRMTSSSLVRTMGQCACTHWKPTRMKRWSHGLPSPFGILHCHQMANGQQLPASTFINSFVSNKLLICPSELAVKIVNLEDSFKILYLRDLPKPAKHLSYDPSGTFLAASCTDGAVYLYSLSKEEPELKRKIQGVIRSLDIEAETSSKAAWHPDGRAFAAPTATRDIQVISHSDGELQRSFSGGHMGDITALAWSPNGALLLTAGKDRKVLLWDTKSQKIVARYASPPLSIRRWSTDH